MNEGRSRKVALSKVYIDDEIRRVVLDVIDSGWFVLGERLREFERSFATYMGVKHAVGVSSGTAAIQCALLALGVGAGDEVIVPSNTTIPTVEPILLLGARPIFAEIDPLTYTLDPASVRDKISKKTKAILPVHLYGHPSKMDELLELANSSGSFLIEDCAQAHGALFSGKKVGSLGNAGCFSFYPSKNMTVCGDGGMVITDDDSIADKVRLNRNHGFADKYKAVLVGSNFRLNEIQAAIGSVQLKHLDDFNALRRRWAGRYRELLGEESITLPREMEWAFHVFHLYVVRVERRDDLLSYLNAHGVGAAVHYPIPCHMQPALSHLPRVELRVTESLTREILTLPMHPALAEEDVEYVAETIREFRRSGS